MVFVVVAAVPMAMAALVAVVAAVPLGSSVRMVVCAVVAAVVCLLCAGCSGEEAWTPGKPLAKEKIVLGVLYLDKADSAGYSYAHETAPRVAELLGWPVLTNVCALEIEGTTVRATRLLDHTLEHVECELPAVVSVVPEIAPAPIPGLKSVMGAAKKPKKTVTAEELGLTSEDLSPRTHTVRTTGYVTQRRNIRHEGTPAEIAESLVRALEQDGILA